jgi:tetratricopeptide (TPR) repeat protein
VNSTRSRGVAVLMALSLALLLPATRVTAAPPSPEEKTRAREHYQKGLTHYDIKEYSDALAEFKNAYRVVQDPAFLFNIAQCYRKLGQDVEALDYYRNYLRRFPTAPNRGEVERRIQEIERELAMKAPAGTPAPGTPSPGTPPVVEPPASRPPPGPVTPLTAPPATSAPPPVFPAPPPAATSAPPAAAVVTASPDAGGRGGEPAFYQRWWFWTGVGAVVVAAVVTGIAVATRGEVGDCLGISPCRTVGD